MKTSKHRGPGQPRKPYKTTTIAFRVREEWVDHIKKMVKSEIERLKGE